MRAYAYASIISRRILYNIHGLFRVPAWLDIMTQSMHESTFPRYFFIPAVAVFFALAIAPGVRASVTDEISDLNRRIQQLEAERAQYERQARDAGGKASTLQNEVAKFNAEINQIETQIRSLEANIELTDLEIADTENGIAEAERSMNVHRDALGRYIQAFAEFQNESLVTILLRTVRLSDFFDHLNNLNRTQEELQATIGSMQQLRTELDGEKEELQDHQRSLENLKGLHEVDQRGLSSKKYQKDLLLRETKGQEAQFQGLVAERTSSIERLREQIYYLQKAGISAEDAVSAAKRAALGAGIRPAFLLALLEVESRLGQNVGTGNWQDDMVLCYKRLGDIYYPQRRDHYYNRAQTEENAFLSITSRLGVDPNSVKVSREPTYGCGGAMGPAQFIPSTWLSYEAEVARLTGHNPPNPWNTVDAFTASAIKLARGGASSKTIAGETLAAKRYICGGNITQSICSSYANTVLSKAAAISQDL